MKIEIIKNNIVKLNNKIKRSIGHKDYTIDKLESDQKELESLIKEYCNLYCNKLINNPDLIRE